MIGTGRPGTCMRTKIHCVNSSQTKHYSKVTNTLINASKIKLRIVILKWYGYIGKMGFDIQDKTLLILFQHYLPISIIPIIDHSLICVTLYMFIAIVSTHI